MNVMSTPRRTPATELLLALSDLSFSDLPGTARVQAGLCLMDNIGCGIFGSQFPWTRIATDFVLGEASLGGATVFGSKHPIAPARAALCNGIAIHGYELDDIILGTLSHPGTTVVPAALAMAEHLDASADRLLLGIIAGYEMTARIGVILASRRDVGFHLTGVLGAPAAAVAASVVAGLPSDQVISAVGIACSRSSGTKAFTQPPGGMVKRLHGGTAAESGVVACQLAQRGFAGPPEAIDGRFGILETFGGERGSSELLSAGLGTAWAIERVWTKVYPCCGVLHTAVQGLETLREREKIAPDSIQSIRVGTSRRAVTQNGERSPQDTMGAQYSLPFCAALAIVGDPKDPASYAEANLRDATVMQMIPRVEIDVDPEVEAAYPDRLGNRVEIEMRDGRRFGLTVWDAHGMAADPCAPPELTQKFRRMCARSMDQQDIDRILNILEGYARADGPVAALSGALRIAFARRR